MSPRLRRLARIVSLGALAPFLAGAHCSEDCSKPKTSLVSRPLERTIYGAAFLVADRGATLADTFGPFERRALKVDPSRPVAVIVTSSRGWGDVGRLDGSKLKPGDKGPGYQVVGVLDTAGKLPLFEGAGALDQAKRDGWDMVVLLPRTPGNAPWEAAVTVEMGRVVTPVKDEKTGTCVEPTAGGAVPPQFRLASLPVRCGDGVRQDEEECDDGNRLGGDGCSPFCTKER
jgi:cysteine-rich repeat protein